jgi:hypothetical protein
VINGKRDRSSAPQHKGDNDVTHTHHTHSIGSSFMAHGIQGIEPHHATSRLMAEATAHRNTRDLHPTGAPNRLRYRIGGVMIALGAAIAGKTHDIQERRATTPSPTATSGFFPTR